MAFIKNRRVQTVQGLRTRQQVRLARKVKRARVSAAACIFLAIISVYVICASDTWKIGGLAACAAYVLVLLGVSLAKWSSDLESHKHDHEYSREGWI